LSGVSGQRLDRNGLPGGFGGGAENQTPASWLQAKCAATITTPPLNWSRRLESNQLMRAYQTRARPGTSPAHRRQCLGDKKMEPALGIEPRSRAYRARALPLSYTGWRPVRESNPLLDVTNVAHHHQCLPALERVARVELASLVWKTRAPAAIPYPLSRGGGTAPASNGL
jgi:hypothetical protein